MVLFFRSRSQILDQERDDGRLASGPVHNLLVVCDPIADGEDLAFSISSAKRARRCASDSVYTT